MTRPAGGIEAVISDFGGVLTTPLQGSFLHFQEQAGVPLEALGAALATLEARDGAHPLAELECGRMTEADFLARVGAEISERLGREIHMHAFTETYFSHLQPNHDLIAYMATLRDRGHRMGLLTNNVREWEARWRAMLPVDEIFAVVVDSAFVGMRKPDPRIYELTCERLGVAPEACVFLDDIKLNCDAAAALGMTTVHFRDTAQAIADLEDLVGPQSVVAAQAVPEV
jgi:epoxide hydrolase-like predicted phosphatase